MNKTYPRMKLLSFREKIYDFPFPIFNSCYFVSSWLLSEDDASSYAVWESETFGDRWEVQFSLRPNIRSVFWPWGKTGSRKSPFSVFPRKYMTAGFLPFEPCIVLIPIDGPRGLRLGETFRAVQKQRMTEKAMKARRKQIKAGTLQLQIGVSDEELEKAIRELVRSAVALPLSK